MQIKDTHRSNWSLFKRLWNDYMLHYKWHYLGAICCLSLLAGSNTIIINLVPSIIDDVLDQGDINKATLVAIVMFLTLLGRGIATFGQAILLHSVALNVIRNMQNQMFAVLTSVDMIYLQKSGTAAQISRFTNDVHALSGAISRMVTSFGKEFILLIAMIATMFWYNASMAAVIVIVFPIVLLPIFLIARKIRAVSKDIQIRLSHTTATLDDSLKSAMQVRAYNLQDQERKRAGNLFHKFYSLSLKSQILQNLIYPIIDGLGGIIFSVILIWGAYTVAGGNMSSGEFITFFLAMFAAYTPLRSLSGLYAAVQVGLAAASRIFDLLDYKATITSQKKAPPLKIIKGEIILKNVNFAYDEESPQVLHNINLTFKAGKRSALVGYSGSGKSTLLQLIPRFFECQNGNILIDNQDIKLVNVESLRENIAMVFQNAPLFNTTIAENIALGKQISKQQMQKVCEQALLQEFINELPQGLNSTVGELGSLISGGQRQRIAIARALIKNAPILLLDEATSSLDQQHENILNQAIQKLMLNKTVITIAHRLTTVKNAHTIFLLKNGKIISKGNHAELSENSTYYQKLCQHDLTQ